MPADPYETRRDLADCTKITELTGLSPADGLRALYVDQLVPMKQLAKTIGVDDRVISRWLREAGIQLRTRIEAKRAEMSRWTDADREAFAERNRRRADGLRGKSRPHEAICAAARTKQRNAKLSDDEQVVLGAMNAAGLTPIPLYAIDRHNIDFAFPDIRLAVEYNGGNWHNLPQVRANDERKDALLKSLGWTVLWFPRLDRGDGDTSGPSIAIDELIRQVAEAIQSIPP